MAGNAQLDTGQGGQGADGSREGGTRRATTASRMRGRRRNGAATSSGQLLSTSLSLSELTECSPDELPFLKVRSLVQL